MVVSWVITWNGQRFQWGPPQKLQALVRASWPSWQLSGGRKWLWKVSRSQTWCGLRVLLPKKEKMRELHVKYLNTDWKRFMMYPDSNLGPAFSWSSPAFQLRHAMWVPVHSLTLNGNELYYPIMCAKNASLTKWEQFQRWHTAEGETPLLLHIKVSLHELGSTTVYIKRGCIEVFCGFRWSCVNSDNLSHLSQSIEDYKFEKSNNLVVWVGKKWAFQASVARSSSLLEANGLRLT